MSDTKPSSQSSSSYWHFVPEVRLIPGARKEPIQIGDTWITSEWRRITTVPSEVGVKNIAQGQHRIHFDFNGAQAIRHWFLSGADHYGYLLETRLARFRAHYEFKELASGYYAEGTFESLSGDAHK